MSVAETSLRLWTIKDVVSFTRMSEQSIRRAIARNEFPQPMRLGRLVRWNPDEVRALFGVKGSV